MLIVAALGRSALASPDAAALEARIRRIAAALAPLARIHQLVVTHAAATLLPRTGDELPADLQAASAAGLVGHLLARELRNVLPAASVVSLLAEAAVHGEGTTLSRVLDAEVPPCRIVEMPMLREFADRDDLLLCVGCVPVQQDAEALLTGSGARLDHDQVAATLAVELRADILLLLTDVAGIHPQWPSTSERVPRFAAQQPVPEAFDAATIGSKLKAACRFARTPGTFAAIGAADEAGALVAQTAGTCVALAP